MHRVHFIAIGSPVLRCLAIASSKKNNITVSGSDIEIAEPAYSKLKLYGILPEKMGWFPEKINKSLTSIVIGQNVAADNPELLKAKEIGLRVLSYPEYVYLQTRSKTRIVVGGSFGKTTIASMIVFVLKQLRIDTDYLIESPCLGFENTVNLTFDARIAVIEGDESFISTNINQSKFSFYKAHIAILTGIDCSKKNASSSSEEYIDLFKKFTDSMEVQGRLIYFEGDANLIDIASKLRRDIVPFAYKTPKNEVLDGITFLKSKKGKVPIKISGEFNLQNIEAARIACRQIGVTDDQFYSVIGGFAGVSN